MKSWIEPEIEMTTVSESESLKPIPLQDLGLCGFPPDLDFARWEECEPEPAIRDSRLTAEQKAKFRGHLDKIFHPDTIKGVRVSYPLRLFFKLR